MKNKLYYNSRYRRFYVHSGTCNGESAGITFDPRKKESWTWEAVFGPEDREYEEVADMFDILTLIEERISDRGAT